MATGKITADARCPRHRRQEFLRFLKKVAAARPDVELHVVLDSYSYSYSTRTRQAIRRGAFRSVKN